MALVCFFQIVKSAGLIQDDFKHAKLICKR